MPQRLAELWYGVDVSATNSTRRLLPSLGLVSKLNCLTPLSGPCTTWLPRSTLRPMCNQAATLHSQTSVQLDRHAPLSDQWAIKLPRSTLRPVYNLIATLHSQTSGQSSRHAPLSRRLEQLHTHCGNSSCCCRCRCCCRPTGSVPHSEPIVSTVRHVTGTGSGLLEEIPRSGVQISALT